MTLLHKLFGEITMGGLGAFAQFIIVCLELVFLGAIIFIGIDFVIALDANFKKLAKYGVGAALTLYFLFAVLAVLGMSVGVQAAPISPVAFIWLVVEIIILFLVLYIVNLVIDKFAPVPAKEIITFVANGIALIVLLGICADTLSGGTIQNSFRAGRHAELNFQSRSVAALSAPASEHLQGLLIYYTPDMHPRLWP